MTNESDTPRTVRKPVVLRLFHHACQLERDLSAAESALADAKVTARFKYEAYQFELNRATTAEQRLAAAKKDAANLREVLKNVWDRGIDGQLVPMVRAAIASGEKR